MEDTKKYAAWAYGHSAIFFLPKNTEKSNIIFAYK